LNFPPYNNFSLFNFSSNVINLILAQKTSHQLLRRTQLQRTMEQFTTGRYFLNVAVHI